MLKQPKNLFRSEKTGPEKGEEKGYFEFGGSTVCLFVPKGSAVPDADMIKNTAEGFETLVKMGEQIGKRK